VPTYQYACTACEERMEAVQSFTDAPLTECPACGGALRKVFSAVGVVFKGSGFYKTDSRSAAKSETKSEGKSESKSESKSSGDATTSTSSGDSKTSSSSDSKAGSKPAGKPAAATPASKTA